MRIIYGYQVVGDRVCIKESEATIVSLIYDMYLEGSTLRKISYELYYRGIKSPSGNDYWSAQYIDNVLSSRKCIDIVTFKKYVDVCFERNRRSQKYR